MNFPLSPEFMTHEGWALFSGGAAVFLAAMYLVNQYLLQPGHTVIFWSRVVTVLLMTPFVATLSWPTDPVFYIVVASTVFLGSFADIRTMNVSAKYGGGVVSRVQPLTVWLSFFLWFFFDPALLGRYAEHPFNTLGILAALTGCVWFAARMNKCAISRQAFIDMLPALLGYTCTTVLNKYAMHHGTVNGAVFGYMYVQSVLATVFIGIYCMTHLRKGTPKGDARKTALAAGLVSLTWIGHMILKNYAMAYTPNPSYQGALCLTAPVFIALYYKAVGHKEEADTLSGMGIVACAVLLAILTV